MTLHARQAGFTLVELVTVMTIAVVVLVATLPAFRDVLNNNRITTQVNRLISDVQLARSEAMRRGERVVLCRSGNPTAGAPRCGGTSGQWTEGWLVFVDVDKNGTFNDGDSLVRVTSKIKGGIAVLANAYAATAIQFNADASTNHDGNTVRIALCDERGSEFGKQIDIPPVGRPRVADRVNSCASPG